MSDLQVYNNRISRQLQVQPYTPIRKQLFIGQLGSSSSTLYTAPSAPTIANPVGSNPKAVITYISVCNTDASDRTFTLYVIESGGSVAANRAIFSAATVKAGQTLTYTNQEIVLEASGTFRGLASSANLVTVLVCGYELL